jgi:hypothetical protein
VPAYSILSSYDVPRHDLDALLAPYNPEPSYTGTGLQEGWSSIVIEEPLVLHVYPDDPYELPPGILNPSGQLMGAHVVYLLSMFSFSRPGTPMTPVTSVEEMQRNEQEGLRINALERDLVWCLACDFSQYWPGVLSDHTGDPDGSFRLSLLGQPDAVPPWQLPREGQAPPPQPKRGFFDRLFGP